MKPSSASPRSGFDSSSESDLAFVRRLLAGDAPAFERFFQVAFPALFRFALARVDLDRDAAGEVAQAALCRAIARLDTYRGEAALLTWLCTFCRHEIYAWRTARGRAFVELVEDDPEVQAALESLRGWEAGDPEADLDHRRTASLVQRVLDHLPVHYAEALEWKYIDELPVREIGVRLGMGPKAAESLLTRARRAFRDAVSACGAGVLIQHGGEGRG